MKQISLKQEHIYSGSLILVNEKNPFRGVENDSLVPVSESKEILLQRQAAVMLSNLMEEIHGWETIVPVSGWRSYTEQQKIWEETQEKEGVEFTKKFVAVPGHSEHQTGLAIDLGLQQDNMDFICPVFPYTGICQRFRKRAASYGFIERYPAGKEHVTGIGHEPWHFRYVGAPHATIMVKNGLAHEEYITYIKSFRYSYNPYVIPLGNQEILISYLSARKDGDTTLETRIEEPYSISGDNIDGFIITEWR